MMLLALAQTFAQHRLRFCRLAGAEQAPAEIVHRAEGFGVSLSQQGLAPLERLLEKVQGSTEVPCIRISAGESVQRSERVKVLPSDLRVGLHPLDRLCE